MHRKHRSINRRRSSIDALSMLSRDNSSPTQLEADGDSRTPSDIIDSADIKQSLQVVVETDERALQELDQEKEQKQLEEIPQPQPGDRGAPRDSDGPPEQQQQTIENPSPRLSLPLTFSQLTAAAVQAVAAAAAAWRPPPLLNAA